MSEYQTSFRNYIWWVGVALLAGCSSTDFLGSVKDSPIASLVVGDTYPDEYLQKVEAANRSARRQEQLETNTPTERAYNTVSGRYEFVPADTEQRWNEKEQRWEFTPTRKP